MNHEVKRTINISLHSKSFEVYDPFDPRGWTVREFGQLDNDEWDVPDLWNMVIRNPRFEDILDEDWVLCYSAVKQIILPFKFLAHRSCVLTAPSVLHQVWKFPFGPHFTELDRFFDAYSLLTKACGTYKSQKALSRELVRLVMNTGLEIREEDWKEYSRETHSGREKKECLLLPLWVRNRLVHPENPFEYVRPNVQDIRRATIIGYGAHWSTLLNSRNKS